MFCRKLFGETLNLAVLDSECTKTVCGEEWLKCYTDSLSDLERKKIQSFASNTKSRFGDGKSAISEKCVLIPGKIAGKAVTIKKDFVNSEIPLLLSKESMKCVSTKINFLEDKVNIFGKDISLHFTSSDHYAIPLNDSYERSASLDDSRFIEVFLTIDNICNKSQAEKVQIAIKLHKQFGHPKGSRLINLIKSAGISDNVLLDAVQRLDGNYSICLKYKKQKSRPAVGFLLAHNFNETVAMDIKQFRNVYILHLIDHATRFSVAAIIHSRCKEVIISKIFKH